MADFEGVWKTEVVGFPGGSGAFQAELRYSEGRAENIHHEFPEVGGRPRSTSRRTTRYVSQAGDESGTYVLSHVSAQSYFTVHDPDHASKFNARRAGGFDDWAAGTEKNVTGVELLGHAYAPEGESSADTLRVTSDELTTSAYDGLVYRKAT